MTNFGHIWEASGIVIAVEYMSLKPGHTSGKEYKCECHYNLQQLNNEIGFNILRLIKMNVLCEHQTLSMKLLENHLFSIHK